MEINVIYEGDNLEILSKFPNESVNLIYADPPFFSNQQYEKIWGDKAEIRSFEDRWKGGIEHYISWMEPRLRECFRVLKKDGLICLHCDWHAGHYLKIMMDKIFGENNFRNEIIWHYRTGNLSDKQLQRKHDIILVYSKSNKWTYNPIEIKEYYSQIYGQGFKPSFKGRKSGKDEFGEYRISFVDDVWDISAVFTLSKEHLGYPTQKPLKLLDRIIYMFSNEGDIVLDPFCGCGTTIVASHKLKRKWIGIDISPTACKLMKKRLRQSYTVNAQIIRGNVDINYVKKLEPFEFQNWVVVDKFLGTISKTKSGDMGIDGLTPQILGGYPIQVKQSEGVGRNVVDNFKSAIERVKKDKGYIVAFSFGKGAYEEVARVKNQEGITIILRTIEDLLNGKIEE